MTEDNRHWRLDAECADSDIDFFSEDLSEKRKALDLCKQCPVRKDCLQSALDTEERFGIWGGVDERVIRRTLAIDKSGYPISRKHPPKCPYCRGKTIHPIEKRRTRTRMKCATCALVWWTRRPVPKKKKTEAK